MQVGDDGEIDFDKPSAETVAFLNKLRAFIIEKYPPVSYPNADTIYMSTAEIFHALQNLFPSIHYSQTTISEWLHTDGYLFADQGKMRFEWMMGPAK